MRRVCGAPTPRTAPHSAPPRPPQHWTRQAGRMPPQWEGCCAARLTARARWRWRRRSWLSCGRGCGSTRRQWRGCWTRPARPGSAAASPVSFPRHVDFFVRSEGLVIGLLDRAPRAERDVAEREQPGDPERATLPARQVFPAKQPCASDFVQRPAGANPDSGFVVQRWRPSTAAPAFASTPAPASRPDGRLENSPPASAPRPAAAICHQNAHACGQPARPQKGQP